MAHYVLVQASKCCEIILLDGFYHRRNLDMESSTEITKAVTIGIDMEIAW